MLAEIENSLFAKYNVKNYTDFWNLSDLNAFKEFGEMLQQSVYLVSNDPNASKEGWNKVYEFSKYDDNKAQDEYNAKLKEFDDKIAELEDVLDAAKKWKISTSGNAYRSKQERIAAAQAALDEAIAQKDEFLKNPPSNSNSNIFENTQYKHQDAWNYMKNDTARETFNAKQSAATTTDAQRWSNVASLPDGIRLTGDGQISIDGTMTKEDYAFEEAVKLANTAITKENYNAFIGAFSDILGYKFNTWTNAEQAKKWLNEFKSEYEKKKLNSKTVGEVETDKNVVETDKNVVEQVNIMSDAQKNCSYKLTEDDMTTLAKQGYTYYKPYTYNGKSYITVKDANGTVFMVYRLSNGFQKITDSDLQKL
jgi:hypothetical protein